MFSVDNTSKISQPGEKESEPLPEYSFSKRVLIALGLAALVFVILWVLYFASELFLTVFAAILIAILFRSFGKWVHGHTRLSLHTATIVGASVIIVLLLLSLVIAAPIITNQVRTLVADLPESITQLQHQLMRYEWVRVLSENVGWDQLMPGTRFLIGQTAPVARSVLGIFGTLLFMLVVGILFAVEPRPYWHGMVILIPPPRRHRVEAALSKVEESLRWWLVGIFALMVLVGIASTIGLMIIGIPLAIVLGAIAGLLNFIPTLGPIIAAIPAVLIAFTQSPQQTLMVVILYSVIQFLEGYILAPYVMHKAIRLPPAGILIAQILFGILFGLLGLALAIPLFAAVVIIIQQLYLHDTLGEDVELVRESS